MQQVLPVAHAQAPCAARRRGAETLQARAAPFKFARATGAKNRRGERPGATCEAGPTFGSPSARLRRRFLSIRREDLLAPYSAHQADDARMRLKKNSYASTLCSALLRCCAPRRGRHAPRSI